MDTIRLKMSLFRKVKSDKQPLKSEYAAFCAVGIYMHYKEGIDYCFTPRIFYNNLLGKELGAKVKSVHTEGIKRGLEELKQKKWIDYVIVGKTYCVTWADIFNEEELWFSVPIEYIDKVVNTKSGVKLLYYYLFLLSTINIEKKCGFMSQENISNTLGIPTRTLSDRNKKLKDLEVICFKQRSDKNIKGQFINLTSLYYLPENENVIKNFKEESLSKEVQKINEEIMKEHKETRRRIDRKDSKINYTAWINYNKEYIENPF